MFLSLGDVDRLVKSPGVVGVSQKLPSGKGKTTATLDHVVVTTLYLSLVGKGSTQCHPRHADNVVSSILLMT